MQQPQKSPCCSRSASAGGFSANAFTGPSRTRRTRSLPPSAGNFIVSSEHVLGFASGTSQRTGTSTAAQSSSPKRSAERRSSPRAVLVLEGPRREGHGVLRTDDGHRAHAVVVRVDRDAARREDEPEIHEVQVVAVSLRGDACSLEDLLRQLDDIDPLAALTDDGELGGRIGGRTHGAQA
jgi:hypothetical protein